MPPLPFAEWRPDAPALGVYAREASGLIPEKDGYRPFKSLSVTSTALTARAQGAAWFRAPNGSTKNFAGDQTKLYLLDSDQAWQNVSRLEAAKTITAITQANPGAVTAAAHGYTTGDVVWIEGVVGMTEVNDAFYTITVSDVNTFTIGVDTTGFTAYVSDGTAEKVDFYATDGTGNWRFAQFQDKAYATNGVDELQSFDLNAGTNWVDATGSPPVGDYIATVRRFLVLASIGTNLQRVQWSGDNDVTTWTPSVTTGSDTQDLPDGGAITGLVGGEVGLIFQETAITRMTFEGEPTWLRLDKIALDLGATIPNTVAGWGGIAFFYHTSGFYMVRGAQEIVPIGRDRIDRWFAMALDQTNSHRVTAAIDPVNSLYCLSFPTGTSGVPEEILVYNWKADRWAHAAVTCEMIYSGATQAAWTLEDLDEFTTIEGVPYSLDSTYWTGVRQLLLSGFDTSHKSGAFADTNLAAQIDSQEVQPIPGKRCRIRSARPLVDGGTPSMQLGTRVRQQDAVTWSTLKALNRDGIVPFNRDSRYVRFRLTMAAAETWEWLQAVDDIDARPSGSR